MLTIDLHTKYPAKEPQVISINPALIWAWVEAPNGGTYVHPIGTTEHITVAESRAEILNQLEVLEFEQRTKPNLPLP